MPAHARVPNPDGGLELASLVLRKLPCELRDYVYSYLWDGSMEKVDYMKLICLRIRAEANGVEADACTCHSAGIPAFALKGVMGHDFAYEAVSWLYNNHLDFTVNDFAGIGPFLSMDAFHVGLSPSVCNLRRLGITFHLPIHDDTETLRNQDLSSSIMPLLNLKLRPGFQIHIHFGQASEDRTAPFSLFYVYLILQHFRPFFDKVEKLTDVHIDVHYHHVSVGNLGLNHMVNASMGEWVELVHGVFLDNLKIPRGPSAWDDVHSVVSQMESEIEVFLDEMDEDIMIHLLPVAERPGEAALIARIQHQHPRS